MRRTHAPYGTPVFGLSPVSRITNQLIHARFGNLDRLFTRPRPAHELGED